MRIIIGGALGRMGRELTLAAEAAGVTVACGVDVAYCGQTMPYAMVSGYEQVTESADVIVDFSRPDALAELLKLAVERKTPVVLCATGYTEQELAMIAEAAEVVPVLRSANMSLGVNVLCELVRMAARTLDGFDIEIVEKHHRMKADSPSGTAVMLYEAAQKEKGSETEPVYGRYGRTEKRTDREIGIHAVRGGTVTGVHEVGFYGNGEQVILTHQAENRALFAQGALKAARFLKDKPAGMYSMRDVVLGMLG
ncbi:MAG: 4-hydroxy-tetrahydrodipicolinate reductase [Clostridia bacterium]|nr:4-hydroxy-tetrahydrodipicolinate reductase [Clostridia bacterium]